MIVPLTKVQVRPDEDGVWIAKSSLLPGCHVIFEVHEDEADGGYTASALGGGMRTEAETLEELRRNVLEAVDCYYDDPTQAPKIIRLQLA
jgi:predicted RNase H-like HicB family nuclease